MCFGRHIRPWVLALVLLPAPGFSQSDVRGGMLFTFAVEAGLDGATNPALLTTPAHGTGQSKTALSFGFLTQTRVQQLSIETGISLQKAQGPRRVGKDGFADPFLMLAYERLSKTAVLSFSAGMRATDLSQSNPTTLVRGSATQQTRNAEMSLRWRENTPLRFGILAGIQDISYQDGTAFGLAGKTLNDIQHQKLRFSLALDLNAAAQLNSALTYRASREAGTLGVKESIAFESSLRIDRPTGAFEVSAGHVRHQTGHRSTVMVQHQTDLPNGQMMTRLGVSRAASGAGYVVGGLAYQRVLHNGHLDVALTRDVATSQEDNTEQISTKLGLLYAVDITPVDGVELTLDWSKVEDTQTRQSTTSHIIGISYAHSLAPDAKLNLGLRQRYMRDTTTGTARSNEVYVSLTRMFKARR